MTRPHIMPLGFIDRLTDDGAIVTLTNPEDSRTLETGAPITVWNYSREYLAMSKTRGHIRSVGYSTARFVTAETEIDPRWPNDQEVLREKIPVYLAQQNSFEPDPSRMLTQEQTVILEDLSHRYRRIVGDGPDNPDGETDISRLNQ